MEYCHIIVASSDIKQAMSLLSGLHQYPHMFKLLAFIRQRKTTKQNFILPLILQESHKPLVFSTMKLMATDCKTSSSLPLTTPEEVCNLFLRRWLKPAWIHLIIGSGPRTKRVLWDWLFMVFSLTSAPLQPEDYHKRSLENSRVAARVTARYDHWIYRWVATKSMTSVKLLTMLNMVRSLAFKVSK